MTYKLLPSRKDSVEAILQALEGATSVILTTHLNADGDGSGCEAALLALLLDMGKDGWIVNPTPFPENFRPLLPDPSRVLDVEGEEAAKRCREADLLIVVDTGAVDRIGKVAPLVEHLPALLIDHHPPGPDLLPATITFLDTSAAAAGELVFDLLRARGGPWTRSSLDGLYVAIFTDTGGFRFSNSTPGAYRAAADLVERGASPDDLARFVHGQSPLRRIRLLERALATLEQSPDGRVAWMTIPADAYKALGCKPNDLEGLVDYPRDLEGVEVGLIFREIEPGRVKISLRSNRIVDVNALAREFGGGGHVRASGALVLGEGLDPLRARVVERAVEMARASIPEGRVGDPPSSPPEP